MKPFDEVRHSWQRHYPAGKMPWRQVVPGVVVLGLVVGARLLGLFEGLELKMLDQLLRWRPAEATDERVLIVGIDEADIQRLGTYPVPDGVLAELLQTLAAHRPRAVGIDIYRDLAVEPGHAALVETLDTLPYAIAIENILSNPPVAGPTYLPPEQVGFVDFPQDDDGFVRRALLGSPNAVGEFRFSLALRLAETYLQAEGLTLKNGRRDPWAMRFGSTEFSQISPQTGGYVGADAGGHQVLLNGRSGPQPFRRVSLQQVLDGSVDPTWIENAIVLVGITSSSAKDFLNSAAVATDSPGLVYGVVMQAHATSQLVSAVLDDRPLLRPWPDGLEYLWIVLWGGMGTVLIWGVRSPSWYLLTMGLIGLGLVGVSFGLLWLGGWWIPLVPTLVVFSVNGLVLPGFYLYDQTLRSRIAERQQIIDQTYSAIHNGPLQTLALLLREADPVSWAEARPKLERLNQELRDIRESLPAVALPGGDQSAPLHEKLWETYTTTLERGEPDFPGLRSLKLKVVTFEPLSTLGLSADDQQGLRQFLEEALLNVGKHGVNVTRLTVVCQATDTENLIQVIDNGQGPYSLEASPAGTGWGTRQAKQLAQRLKGQFKREFSSAGTCCELRWPLVKPHRLGFWGLNR
ncbi:CHASE2 domain-containing protein [Nodosilinea sp. LEGE 06152]|uniref:sensor histidine kinase n=1 Tax=Nodosilinea sp. LEGE 06152 TaxID=2777966 RepID=UPI00187FC574|nr:CHASE2 domain-containing protein [Nodosilinea sp. LEGE 06152]MBE9157953.1 CHASE2 domain-containing protein [Nodosilinea sp. LEGE 06152]